MDMPTAWPLWRMLALALALLLGLACAQPVLAQADPDREAATAVGGVSPDTWRQVRSGEVGPNFRDSRADSTYNLINASGESWRQLRNRWVSPFGLIAVGGMIVVIALFYVIVGRKDLSEPRTGRKLLRWPLVVRSIHWTVATLFIVLALSGLNLLYGKFVFRPLFGDAVWGAMISASKVAHNYLGPLFGILLVVLLARVLKHNWPKRHDLAWFRQGGGLVGKGHPDAGFANGGEKLWFWLLATAGLAVVASGFVLDFPNYGQSRDTMQWANIIHAVGALGLTAVALGHIYIGTIGSEGSLEGMTTGYVDETWARDHHNLWYEEVKDQAIPEEQLAAGRPAPDGGDEAASRPG
ncbi:formate dehydrogenase subunit gamma [Halomonas campaniensis]|uniref:Formate dehydrogenase subunit gamma n=1 Tax=Halomonas campaniensis TaxID=213554 RepID=A0A7W5PAB4_9GAMM|nr:formate dehydrogenase subunit gamma [Halomonas campaniensis]MBB3330427.1 formate dehydrogenase subunit gamma [Halomonas campaniensis]